MKLSHYAKVSATCLVLAGCSAPALRTTPAMTVATEAEVARLQQWTVWQARGRLAVKTANDGFNAHFNWRQAVGETELVVEGPFGAGHSRVLASAERIRLEAGGQPALEFHAPFEGAESALAERVGFGLPLGALAFWLRGVPDPVAVTQAAPVANAGTVSAGVGSFAQAGWRIQPEGPVIVERAPAALPSRVTLTRGDVRIRVVIDQWSAEP